MWAEMETYYLFNDREWSNIYDLKHILKSGFLWWTESFGHPVPEYSLIYFHYISLILNNRPFSHAVATLFQAFVMLSLYIIFLFFHGSGNWTLGSIQFYVFFLLQETKVHKMWMKLYKFDSKTSRIICHKKKSLHYKVSKKTEEWFTATQLIMYPKVLSNYEMKTVFCGNRSNKSFDTKFLFKIYNLISHLRPQYFSNLKTKR